MSKNDNSQPVVIHDSDGFLPGLILGGLLGGATYFLLYTKKGREIAKEIFDIGKGELELLKNGEYKLSDTLINKTGEISDDLRDIANKIVDHVSDKYREIQEKSPEIISESTKKIQQLSEKVTSKKKTSSVDSHKNSSSRKSNGEKMVVAPKKRFKRIVKIKPKFFAKKGKSLGK